MSHDGGGHVSAGGHHGGTHHGGGGPGEFIPGGRGRPPGPGRFIFALLFGIAVVVIIIALSQ